jgi:hypothetical protein
MGEGEGGGDLWNFFTPSHLNGVGATSIAQKWEAKASPSLFDHASVRHYERLKERGVSFH